ncbi:unnamed protein product [Closterium sp. NIES-65]|nr:unnamed protein product [Closterium sp. NIES-65]
MGSPASPQMDPPTSPAPSPVALLPVAPSAPYPAVALLVALPPPLLVPPPSSPPVVVFACGAGVAVGGEGVDVRVLWKAHSGSVREDRVREMIKALELVHAESEPASATLQQTPSSASSSFTTTSIAFSNPRLPSHQSSSIRTTGRKFGRSRVTRTLRLDDEAAADSLKILRRARIPRTLLTLMHNANTLTAAQATPERLFLLLDMAAVVDELMPQVGSGKIGGGRGVLVIGVVGVERLVCWPDSEGLMAEWRGLTRGEAKAVLGTFDALTAMLQVPVEQPRRNKWNVGWIELRRGREGDKQYWELGCSEERAAAAARRAGEGGGYRGEEWKRACRHQLCHQLHRHLPVQVRAANT